MTRKAISPNSQESVLKKCGRVCCLCLAWKHDPNVKIYGQLAHIDRDNENSNEENIAWLCLEHHAIYDSRPIQSKWLQPCELFKAKTDLEDAIASGSLPKPYSSPGAVLEVELNGFQLHDISHRPHNQLVYFVNVTVCNIGNAATGLKAARLLRQSEEVAFPTLIESGAVSMPELNYKVFRWVQDEMVGPGQAARWIFPFVANDYIEPLREDNRVLLDPPVYLELRPVKGGETLLEVTELRVTKHFRAKRRISGRA